MIAAACELGIEKPEELKLKIEQSRGCGKSASVGLPRGRSFRGPTGKAVCSRLCSGRPANWSWGRPTANEDGTGVAAFIIPSPVQNEGIVMRMCVSRMQGVGLALAAFVLLAAGATARGDSVTDKLRTSSARRPRT